MLLQQKNVEFTEIRADLDPSKLTEMLAKSDGRRTFPQIFINGKGIGGFSDLWDLEQRDQLNKLLNEEN